MVPPLGDHSQAKQYKVKLASGRILGPISLNRIKKLILKEKITGDETVRVHPSGPWKDINQFEEIAELIIEHVQGQLSADGKTGVLRSSGVPIPGVDETLAATVKLPDGFEVEESDPKALPGAERAAEEKSFGTLPGIEKAEDETGTKTVVGKTPVNFKRPLQEDELSGTKTVVGNLPAGSDEHEGGDEDQSSVELQSEPNIEIAREATVILPRNQMSLKKSKKSGGAGGPPKRLRLLLVAALAVLIGMELLEPDIGGKVPKAPQGFRPKPPPLNTEYADPQKSKDYYNQGLGEYLKDTVQGYKESAKAFYNSASYDSKNRKAMAMLASSYLNLIDASSKDKTYFTTINQILELAKSKDIDLAENVLAEVEYFLMIGRYDAAQKRLDDYKVDHPQIRPMIVYMEAKTHFLRGDFERAATAIAKIPQNAIASPRVFYLRGQIAERTNQLAVAYTEYQKALKLFKDHARSHLAAADVLMRDGKLKSAESHLKFLLKNVSLLSRKDRAKAYYFASIYSKLIQEWKNAYKYIVAAVGADPKNSAYRLEMYTLRHEAGESLDTIKGQARMYYHMGQGEKYFEDRLFQKALDEFLEAREFDTSSAQPLFRIAESFVKLNDLQSSIENFKKGLKLDSKNISMWSRYVEILIESYEWEDAAKAIKAIKVLPNSKSTADKLQGDLYAKQGSLYAAVSAYERSMARSQIDSNVYVAYARTLQRGNNFEDARFFYVLARRFDPLNMETLIGISECIAELESVEKAIRFLYTEQTAIGKLKAELLAEIAKLVARQGSWRKALQILNQSKMADDSYATTWKIEAEIYLKERENGKDFVERALRGYRAYSERNTTDPSGYIERYKIFMGLSRFQAAGRELDKVIAMFPKFPDVRFYKGVMFQEMKLPERAIKEFEAELEIYENSVNTLMSLGQTLTQVKKPYEALKHLERAMKLVPKMAETKALAGDANLAAGNVDGAVALYQQASSLDPRNTNYYKRLYQAYQRKGDVEKAAQAKSNYLKFQRETIR